MTVAATIAEAIEQIAKQGFATVTVGGETVTVKSVDELIKADQYLKAVDAASTSHLGIRMRRISPNYR